MEGTDICSQRKRTDGRWDGEGGREGVRAAATALPWEGSCCSRRAAVVAETEFRQFTTAATQTPLQRRAVL